MSDPTTNGLSEVKNGVGEANPSSSTNQSEVNVPLVKQEQRNDSECRFLFALREFFPNVF